MIYLDNAATTLRKPPAVGAAMLRALNTCTAPGRGIHEPAMNGAETVYSCREAAAKLFHVPTPEQVVFTSSATHGLNIAIHSLVRPGDRVVISGYEHNAVCRPLWGLNASVDVATAPLFEPERMLEAFEKRIPGAAAVICTHVSNVFGYILPIYQIGALCRKYGVPLIVDAAQSAGVQDVDFMRCGAEYIAMAGHKGLMGPQGTGLLLCKNNGIPLLRGGTGSMSLSQDMPADLPERLEAGTHNVCGIAGLLEGIRFIWRHTPEMLRRREHERLRALAAVLKERKELCVYFRDDPALQSGAVSVIPADGDCEKFAERLGREKVAVRPGLHCAPLAHKTAGTAETGTVRFSVSPLTTGEEIRRLRHILQKI